MRFLMLFLAAALPLAAADQPPSGQDKAGRGQAGHDQHPPLTDAEKALMDQIRDLHQQIEQKRKELLALLEKDHPKLAEEMRRHMEEMRQHEGKGPGQEPGPGQGSGKGRNHQGPGQPGGKIQ